MKKKVFVKDIVAFLSKTESVSIIGDIENAYIDNLADINNVNETTLDWINPTKLNKQLAVEKSAARVVLVDNTVEYTNVLSTKNKVLIVVSNPKVVLAKIGLNFFVDKIETGIHPTAIVDSNAVIGKDVYIGPYTVIGKAIIGDNCIISAHCRIYDCVIMGNNCYLKDGVVLGGPGFGFEIDETGHRFRFPQIGKLIMGHNIEVGSNTCIDRGALSNTVIGNYVKIDNHCHVAHNCIIGDDSILTANVTLYGSCEIGRNVWLAPNSSVMNRVKVGDGAFVCASSFVMRNVKPGDKVFGVPANKVD